jgi:hypothetical protein
VEVGKVDGVIGATDLGRGLGHRGRNGDRDRGYLHTGHLIGTDDKDGLSGRDLERSHHKTPAAIEVDTRQQLGWFSFRLADERGMTVIRQTIDGIGFG